MDKRYQVFVSSTFNDLKKAREILLYALLRLECLPAGMELFPAAADDVWTLIHRVIDQCDYYIVIVGNRYGSLGPGGKSYTELEYDYAVATGKPVLAFLHADPDSLPFAESERSSAARTKLAAFRARLMQRLCATWTSPDELATRVTTSLVSLFKTHPATGWLRPTAVGRISPHPELFADAALLGVARLFGEMDSLVAQVNLSEFVKGAAIVYVMGTTLSVSMMKESLIREHPYTRFRFIYSQLSGPFDAAIERALQIIHNAPIRSKLEATDDTMAALGKSFPNVEYKSIPFIPTFSAILALSESTSEVTWGRLQLDHYLLRVTPDRRFWVIVNGPGTLLFDRYRAIIEDIWNDPSNYTLTAAGS